MLVTPMFGESIDVGHFWGNSVNYNCLQLKLRMWQFLTPGTVAHLLDPFVSGFLWYSQFFRAYPRPVWPCWCTQIACVGELCNVHIGNKSNFYCSWLFTLSCFVIFCLPTFSSLSCPSSHWKEMRSCFTRSQITYTWTWGIWSIAETWEGNAKCFEPSRSLLVRPCCKTQHL